MTDRCSVAVTPVSGERVGLFSGKKLCLVILTKPQAAVKLDVHALAALFKLTPAEAKLAEAICNGEPLANYAAANEISVTTVKTHLRALFGKTGVSRQADLVRVMLTDPILCRPMTKECPRPHLNRHA